MLKKMKYFFFISYFSQLYQYTMAISTFSKTTIMMCIATLLMTTLVIGLFVYGIILITYPITKSTDYEQIATYGFYDSCNITSMKSIWHYTVGTDAVYTCNYMPCNETTTDTTVIYYNSNNKLCIEQYGIEPSSTHTSLADRSVGIVCIVLSCILCVVTLRQMFDIIKSHIATNQLEPTINNEC